MLGARFLLHVFSCTLRHFMTSRIPTLVLPLAMIVCSALLAGCAGSDRLTADSSPASGPPDSAAAAGTAPPFSLAGRWTLSSTGTGSCAMTFGAGQDATEGTIAPTGGCPFNFFTSRKWTYSQTGLTIRDHHAQVLAQLTPAGPNRFAGKTSAGQDVALSR
jgi:Protease inhibitor Inh